MTAIIEIIIVVASALVLLVLGWAMLREISRASDWVLRWCGWLYCGALVVAGALLFVWAGCLIFYVLEGC